MTTLRSVAADVLWRNQHYKIPRRVGAVLIAGLAAAYMWGESVKNMFSGVNPSNVPSNGNYVTEGDLGDPLELYDGIFVGGPRPEDQFRMYRNLGGDNRAIRLYGTLENPIVTEIAATKRATKKNVPPLTRQDVNNNNVTMGVVDDVELELRVISGGSTPAPRPTRGYLR
ncbi:MAG: hypothetical protein V1740_06985 [Candidatus Woesearchaeota archaeon]